MDSSLPASADARPITTSVWARLINILAIPSNVFEEILAASPGPANWLLPTLLVCASGLVLLGATGDGDHTAAAIGQLSRASPLSTEQIDWLSKHRKLIAGATVCLDAFAGLFWSAFVLWYIGRVPLKTRFPFGKALEVVGLTGSILILGTIVTALLASIVGDPSVKPALSVLVLRLEVDSPTRAALDTLNFFHLWAIAVLALGLSKLTLVTFKEAAFWVFGYWVVARLALIVLA